MRAAEPGLFAEVSADYGPIRAMLGNPDDGVYVVAAPDGAPGTLLRAREGRAEPMGMVGIGPAQMALGEHSIYVTCPQSGQVFQLSLNQPKIESLAGQENVRAIAAGPSDIVYWALATEKGSVRNYSFGSSPPQDLMSTPFPTSLAYDGTALFASGDGPIAVYDFSYYRRRGNLPGRCDGRMLVLTEWDILCADGGAINQMARSGYNEVNTRATFPDATVFDLVAGAGRVFFRLAPRDGKPESQRIMAMPIEGDAKPTVFATLPSGGQSLAMDRCHLYASSGSSIMRWPL
ncbi:hypothetical protein [Pendulispora rubella]|uniref:hypothetical protein n=1 Tax=Pendulispora rubella TaxID=2741070 RepID=UPI0030E56017